MKHTFNALLVLCLMSVGVLQAQTYSLETLQQPYKYLVNPKAITKHDTAWILTYRQKFALGAPWKAVQTAKYDSFAFDNKGYFVFDNKADTFMTSMAMLYLSGGTANFTDKASWPQPSKSFVSSELTGNAGNRITKIEFRNLGIRGGNTKDSINFQVWLYELSGNVEFHYGPSYIADAKYLYGTANGASIGIATMGKKAYTLVDINLVYGDSSKPSLDTNRQSPTNETITGNPANGTVYRFKRASAGISPVTANKNIQVQATGANTWRIRSSKEGKFTYSIINALGQQVLAGQGLGETEINMQNYAVGLYVLSVEDKDGPVVTKLIKQ